MMQTPRVAPALTRLGACTVGALAALAFAAPHANAAFTTGKCQGAAITGSGATFQNGAHNNLWKTTALAGYCGAGVTPPTIAWNPVAANTGSGFGRRSMGARTGDNATGANSRSYFERFAGTDEPPTPTDVSQINLGTDVVGDEGQIHTIPVSVGAIAVLVNLPDGCTGFYDAGNPNVSERGTADRERIQLTGQQVEAAFRGTATWGQLVPSIADGATTGCANLPVKRVVRFDDSGSTYAFKDYLRAIAPGFGWLTDFVTPDTRTWPNPGTLTTSGASGGGSLVTTASTTDGSIAYAELATARGASQAFERQAGADDKYWVQLSNGGAFFDPALNANGFIAPTLAAAKGANCVGADVVGEPTSTLGLWTSTTAVNSGAAYGICTLTYALAFDDNAAAYGASSDEEAKARSVYDYLQAVLSDFGQSGTALATVDQAPLPFEIRQIAVTGATAIGWNKTPSGGGGNPTPTPTPTPTPGPTPIVKPSNAFTISSARTSGNSIRVTLQVPGAGSVSATASGKPKKGKRVSVGRVTARPSASGAVRLTVKMSSKAKAALKKAKKLTVRITVTFQPTGGDIATKTRTITIKAKKKS